MNCYSLNWQKIVYQIKNYKAEINEPIIVDRIMIYYSVNNYDFECFILSPHGIRRPHGQSKNS